MSTQLRRVSDSPQCSVYIHEVISDLEKDADDVEKQDAVAGVSSVELDVV